MAKLSKCTKCGLEAHSTELVEYKRKKYCYDCFEDMLPPDEVDKHFCYLTFQRIMGRKPTQVEWIQMNKMVTKDTTSSTEWTWRKIEWGLEYVYLIEKHEVSEEYGVIGILPYYESRLVKFFNECVAIQNSCEDADLSFGEEDIILIDKPVVREFTKLKSIDSMIDWEEEE